MNQEFDPEEVQRVKIESLTVGLSGRFHVLCSEVLNRLPPEWDEFRTFDFQESQEVPKPDGEEGFVGFAKCLRCEDEEELPAELPDGEETEQIWTVTVYTNPLSGLTDAAAKWAIAHELAHVASGLPTGSWVIGRIPMTQTEPGVYEPAPPKDGRDDAAESIAMNWGFTNELQAFLRETDRG